ncbi:S-layer homology domain-containing protein [Paenibacillus sp. FSL H7-0756]|uniref:S-layer homology domain-containing protein n=1 Tax=Paenibacillus sp. FSL H7-0756 TaxID=2954738 RepID=UPI0030F86ACD
MIGRKIVTVGLSLGLLLGSGGVMYAAADYEGHWSQKPISRWLEKGWLKGYADGSVRPDQAITRAEFITLINGFAGLTAESKVKADFSDLPKTDWAYEEISKALDAGIIKGYGGTIRPGDPVMRQEAAIMVSRLLYYETGSTEVLSRFSDKDQIAGWSQADVAAMINAGGMRGYPDGRFAPKQAMTRAEAIALLDYYNVTSGGLQSVNIGVSEGLGSFEPGAIKYYNNVTVSGYDVLLQNLKIFGDLVLEEGIGNGEVDLDSVEVLGKVIIQGSGDPSVKLKNTTLNQVIVQKKSGTARLVTEGATSVKAVSVQSSVILEEGEGTGAVLTDIDLPSGLAAGLVVTLNGNFGDVNIEAKGPILHLQKGSIRTVKTAASASGLKIELDEGTTITQAILNTSTKVTGTGRVLDVIVKEDE